MKILACRDFGLDCDFVVRDETEEGVMQKASEHTKAAHPTELQASIDKMGAEGFAAFVKSKIKEE